MNARTTTLTTAFAVALVASGCISSAELPKSDVALDAAPLFQSVEDYAAVQIAAVDLCPSGFNSTVTFDAVDQLYGIAVNVAAADTATFETVNNPALDTLVFVYGPDDGSGFYGSLPVTADDDSGAGLQSRATHELSSGKWFVVVATSGGMGQGTVTLRGSGECGSVEPGDHDGDGIVDEADNCPRTVNPDQLDSDGDGLGDACDLDQGIPCTTDDDCVVTSPDGTTCTSACVDGMCMRSDPACGDPQICIPGTACTYVDATGVACEGRCLDGRTCEPPNAGGCGIDDFDLDEDGVPDAFDNCPRTPNPDQADSDGDGFGDACDEGPGQACMSDEDCVITTPDGISCTAACVDGVCAYPTDPSWCDPDPVPCVDGQRCIYTNADGSACAGMCMVDACYPEPNAGCDDLSDTDGDGTPDEFDCAPDDDTVHPNAPEVCNGLDDNCDGQIDDVYDAAGNLLCDPVCDPTDPNAPDSDGDGIPDGCDADSDGDGVPDDSDACPDEPGSPGSGGCP